MAAGDAKIAAIEDGAVPLKIEEASQARPNAHKKQTTSLMTRHGKLILLLGGAAIAVAAAIILTHAGRQIWSSPTEDAAPSQQVSVKVPASVFVPSLYCAFDDITRSSIVVAFDFAVSFGKGGSPRFDERYIGTQGTTQTFSADHSPTWPFAHDEDGTPTITSPDGATRIMLYGLKLATPGVLLIEAGLRSNTFRNLDGQCRQANFDASDR